MFVKKYSGEKAETTIPRPKLLAAYFLSSEVSSPLSNAILLKGLAASPFERVTWHFYSIE